MPDARRWWRAWGWQENPAYKHGISSREYVEMRKAVNDLVRTEREVATLINDSPDEDCFNPPD